MTYRLIEQRGDVLVVEGVDALSPLALGDDQAVLAKHPELVGDGRLLHADRHHQFTNGMGPLT